MELTSVHARRMGTWRYPPPYSCYDVTDADHLLELGAGIFAVLLDGDLAGFRSFGADGQVPGGWYDDAALDTGGGLRPDLLGQGLGRTAVAAGLAFGRSRFAPLAFRVTVAAWNRQALRTVESLGFARVSSFLATSGSGGFEVLLRPEPQG